MREREVGGVTGGGSQNRVEHLGVRLGTPNFPSIKLQAVDCKLNGALLRAGGFPLAGLVSTESTWGASMAIVGKIAKNLEHLLP